MSAGVAVGSQVDITSEAYFPHCDTSDLGTLLAVTPD